MPARARAVLSGTALERALAARRAAGDPPPDAVVVVDVLRATTSLVHAFAHGAAAVRAFATPDEARLAAAELPRADAVLCGERGGVRVPGFDLGNSPREFVAEFVHGRTLFMSTTNGTRALDRTRDARRQLLAAFVNLEATARRLRDLAAESAPGGGFEAWLVAAGKDDAPADEDTACVLALLEALATGAPAFEAGVEPGDEAAAGAMAAARFADDASLAAFLEGTEHGRVLLATDWQFARDVADAARRDAFDVVPEGRGGVIERGVARSPARPGGDRPA